VYQIGKFIQKNVVNLSIKAANVPKDIIFYTIMIKTAYSVVKESQKSKHFSENSRKKSGLGMFVQRVIARLNPTTKRKKI